MITVQVVRPKLRQYNPKLARTYEQREEDAIKANYQSYCQNEHKLFRVKAENKRDCFYCESEIRKQKDLYMCAHSTKCNFFVCTDCTVKNYTRQVLIHQTSQHHFYRQYGLVPAGEGGESDSTGVPKLMPNASDLQFDSNPPLLKQRTGDQDPSPEDSSTNLHKYMT